MLIWRAFFMWLVPGMGDAKGVAGPLLVPTQVAAPAATEAFKKSRRDLPLFISISPSHKRGRFYFEFVTRLPRCHPDPAVAGEESRSDSFFHLSSPNRA